MMEWWNTLTTLNQVFYGLAVFFSVLFIWQLLAALLGLTDDGDGDFDHGGDADGGVDHHDHLDAADTAASFRLVSLRTIITFFTLFTWGSSLYLSQEEPPGTAMGLAALWGLAGMVLVAAVFYWMAKLGETGTSDLDSAVGTAGTVYVDIGEGGGRGEVRVTVSGVVTYVKARSVDGQGLKAGTPVRVLRRLGQNVVEVEPTDSK